MASIKGISLKGIKKTHGMEDEGFIANLYLNNKKIGSCADYGDGGPLSIRYDNPNTEAVFQKLVREYYSEHPAEDPRLEDSEFFIYKLHTLTLLEASYKKGSKVFWPDMVYLDVPFTYDGKMPEHDIFYCMDGETARAQAKVLEAKYQGCTAVVFTSIADFNIT